MRILIADDHPLMRAALRTALEDEEDMEVVAEARNGQEAVEKAQALHPDLILMDLYMPILDGLGAITRIHEYDPKTHILALTSSTAENVVLDAIRAGALGFLLKDVQREELLQAVREVAQGRSYLTQDAADKLMRGLQRSPAATGPVEEPLTDREQEILRMIGQGLTNRQIAQQLVISEGTVRTHIHHFMHKLSLPNRSQAILYSIDQEKQKQRTSS